MPLPHGSTVKIELLAAFDAQLDKFAEMQTTTLALLQFKRGTLYGMIATMKCLNLLGEKEFKKLYKKIDAASEYHWKRIEEEKKQYSMN